MAPQVGLEPTTLRLTAGCSAIELLRSVAAARDTSRLNRPRSSYQTEIHLKNLGVKASWIAAGEPNFALPKDATPRRLQPGEGYQPTCTFRDTRQAAAAIRTADIVRNLLIFQSLIRSKGLPRHTVSHLPAWGVLGRVSSREGRHRSNPEPRYREEAGGSRCLSGNNIPA